MIKVTSVLVLSYNIDTRRAGQILRRCMAGNRHGTTNLIGTRPPAKLACVRRLIINADDLGLTSGVNRGILESHRDGVVTSTTLMACGARFDEAAGLAAQAPRLSVGCHVVLVDGSPVLSAEQVSSLLASASPPSFRVSLVHFACLAAAGRLNQEQIENEVTAQIQKLQAAGISVSHLDSHKHTHMFPVVLQGDAAGSSELRGPSDQESF